MITTINNDRRKFLVQSQGFGSQRDIFCNLEAIPDVLRIEFQPNEEFKVYEYWNRKLKQKKKKRLNEIFAANQVNYKIK